jgi:hypothetical protein
MVESRLYIRIFPLWRPGGIPHMRRRTETGDALNTRTGGGIELSRSAIYVHIRKIN